jgi:hypothetical protein
MRHIKKAPMHLADCSEIRGGTRDFIARLEIKQYDSLRGMNDKTFGSAASN